MEEIGARLKERRESLGLTLYDAETGTKIRRTYLQAIEDGRFSALPAEVFLKGFLRSYGDFLGLDGQALVEEFKTRRRQERDEDPGARPAVEPDYRRQRVHPRRVSGVIAARNAGAARAVAAEPRRRRRAAWPWFVVCLVVFVALAIYGARSGRGPVQPQIALTGGQPAGSGVGGRAVAGGSGAAGPSGSPGAGSAAASSPSPPVPTTVTPQTRQGTTQPFTVRGASSIVARGVLSGRCWVRVWRDGGSPQDAMLQPGQSISWTAARSLRVLVGNPGVLRLSVDGVRLPVFPGAVPLTLVFTVAKGA